MRQADAADAWSVEDAILTIRHEVGTFQPSVMIMLGSGLSDAAGTLELFHSLPYTAIPGLARPSVAGHPGKLLFGQWGNQRVVVFQGRLHRYEGHSWDQVTLPVQIAARLGAGICVFTNASGGINPRLRPGMMVVIDDHMNFMGSNALVGITSSDPSAMFPDMAEAYSPRLRHLLDEAAAMHGWSLAHGVYVGVSGPSYETPAEIRAFALLGGDMIGMSTVGEVLVARQQGLECCAISCVANMAAGISAERIRHQDVIEAGRAVSVQLAALLDTLLRLL